MHIVELLLQEGADINAPGSKRQGKTALQVAVTKRNMPIVRLLDRKSVV